MDNDKQGGGGSLFINRSPGDELVLYTANQRVFMVVNRIQRDHKVRVTFWHSTGGNQVVLSHDRQEFQLPVGMVILGIALRAKEHRQRGYETTLSIRAAKEIHVLRGELFRNENIGVYL